ncbi:MAG: uncharacterized protein A8A55_1891 [Amphiamblys sp. WSBS2006]|nr:MAG: uncharacterized protein A8A55_1891 [Amphiamblys sp. WSBS2006]
MHRNETRAVYIGETLEETGIAHSLSFVTDSRQYLLTAGWNTVRIHSEEDNDLKEEMSFTVKEKINAVLQLTKNTVTVLTKTNMLLFIQIDVQKKRTKTVHKKEVGIETRSPAHGYIHCTHLESEMAVLSLSQGILTAVYRKRASFEMFHFSVNNLNILSLHIHRDTSLRVLDGEEESKKYLYKYTIDHTAKKLYLVEKTTMRRNTARILDENRTIHMSQLYHTGRFAKTQGTILAATETQSGFVLCGSDGSLHLLPHSETQGASDKTHELGEITHPSTMTCLRGSLFFVGSEKDFSYLAEITPQNEMKIHKKIESVPNILDLCLRKSKNTPNEETMLCCGVRSGPSSLFLASSALGCLEEKKIGEPKTILSLCSTHPNIVAITTATLSENFSVKKQSELYYTHKDSLVSCGILLEDERVLAIHSLGHDTLYCVTQERVLEVVPSTKNIAAVSSPGTITAAAFLGNKLAVCVSSALSKHTVEVYELVPSVRKIQTVSAPSQSLLLSLSPTKVLFTGWNEKTLEIHSPYQSETLVLDEPPSALLPIESSVLVGFGSGRIALHCLETKKKKVCRPSKFSVRALLPLGNGKVFVLSKHPAVLFLEHGNIRFSFLETPPAEILTACSVAASVLAQTRTGLYLLRPASEETPVKRECVWRDFFPFRIEHCRRTNTTMALGTEKQPLSPDAKETSLAVLGENPEEILQKHAFPEEEVAHCLALKTERRKTLVAVGCKRGTEGAFYLFALSRTRLCFRKKIETEGVVLSLAFLDKKVVLLSNDQKIKVYSQTGEELATHTSPIFIHREVSKLSVWKRDILVESPLSDYAVVLRYTKNGIQIARGFKSLFRPSRLSVLLSDETLLFGDAEGDIGVCLSEFDNTSNTQSVGGPISAMKRSSRRNTFLFGTKTGSFGRIKTLGEKDRALCGIALQVIRAGKTECAEEENTFHKRELALFKRLDCEKALGILRKLRKPEKTYNAIHALISKLETN